MRDRQNAFFKCYRAAVMQRYVDGLIPEDQCSTEYKKEQHAFSKVKSRFQKRKRLLSWASKALR